VLTRAVIQLEEFQHLKNIGPRHASVDDQARPTVSEILNLHRYHGCALQDIERGRG
jgi:hypothetical protein